MRQIYPHVYAVAKRKQKSWSSKVFPTVIIQMVVIFYNFVLLFLKDWRDKNAKGFTYVLCEKKQFCSQLKLIHSCTCNLLIKRVVSKASNKSRTKLDPKCKMWHFNYSSSGGMQNCNCGFFFLRREWGFVCLIPWRKPCLVIITAARLENHFIVCKRSLQMSQFSGQIYNLSWSNKSCILVYNWNVFG